ncbi:MAG: hypothetical protein L0Z50_22110 [Verrucomicrobiales bacterium]|nr:hypothetical protein [Verrucomicrobiales bacterium]
MSRLPREIQGTLLALQPDGKWIVFRPPEGIVRLNADGTRDSTFAVPTIPGTSPGWPSWPNVPKTAAIQSDGKILVQGSLSLPGSSPLVRLNPDGTLDPTFWADTGGAWDNIIPLDDGRIVALAQGQIFLFNCDGTVNSAFVVSTYTPTADPHMALASQDRLIVSGPFIHIGGIPRAGLAQVFLGDVRRGPPVITVAPHDQTLKSGQTLALSVTTENFACGRYQWLFNGQPIEGMTNRLLSFANVYPPRAGDYSVVVENESGNVTSRVAQVQIEPPPNTAGSLDLSFEPPIDLNGSIELNR